MHINEAERYSLLYMNIQIRWTSSYPQPAWTIGNLISVTELHLWYMKSDICANTTKKLVGLKRLITIIVVKVFMGLNQFNQMYPLCSICPTVFCEIGHLLMLLSQA